ncbi:cupin-like domain-containing protein [Pseudotenacibaculum haliotis]|uniref:Cupin-like domain-containing protein n=1 Tax=Pseudotenacibaculum haliotis TaxID=1862138 RepID=A0ABW5LQE2_9FLAO
MISTHREFKNPFTISQRFGYGFFQFLDHFLSRKLTVKLFGKLRYKLFLSISKTLKKKGKGTIKEVDVRENLSVEEFKKQYLKKKIPVVLKGAAKDWESCQKWTPDFFKELYGEDEVPLIDAIYLEQGVKYVKLKQIIEEVLKGNSSYLRFYNLLSRHPERYDDFNKKWLQKLKHKSSYVTFTQIFIGGKNSNTGLHNSHADNLFVQMHGEKEWVLYPNYFAPLIDPPSTTGGTYRVTPKRGKFGQPFNPFQPDYEDYPLYKYIDGYKVVLQPGDVFYNPPYVWHSVRNNTESIGLGYRWVSAFSAFTSSPLYYFLDLCAYRPSYFKAYKWYKDDSNAEFLYAEKMLKKQQERMKRKESKKK